MCQEKVRLQWVHGPITVVMLQQRAMLRTKLAALQWVHGPITVVMRKATGDLVRLDRLQWVHGPITVVMAGFGTVPAETVVGASMGPRSDNRGYGRAGMPPSFAIEASMGPRSDNRGYGHVALAIVQAR